jgi:hypothetical protein
MRSQSLDVLEKTSSSNVDYITTGSSQELFSKREIRGALATSVGSVDSACGSIKYARRRSRGNVPPHALAGDAEK